MNLLSLLPRFRAAYRALRELEGRESWSRTEIETFQLERLNAVWSHAIAHVPYYRTLHASGMPERFASLDEYRSVVPVLPKEGVRDWPKEFFSEQPQRGRWMRTGGSTGTPMNAYWGKDAHLEMLRTKYRFQAMWGLDIFDRCAFLWGHADSFQPGLAGFIARWKQPIEDRLRNRIRLSAYHLGREELRGHLARIAEFQPASLYGYSRALAVLAAEAQTTGFRCPSLKVAILTAEPAFRHLVAAVEKGFNVPAIIEYGASECGYMAGEWPDRTLRVREDRLLLETLPRDDGRFDIVLTNLSNPSFPLLRYAIGDVTDKPLTAPERGFAYLENVAGRNNDLIITRSGGRLHSARFEALFKYDTKTIRRFRVHQHADGALTVWLERHDPQAILDVTALEGKLRTLVEGYPVRIEVVEALPRTAAGKHRLVMSDLDVAGPPVQPSRQLIPDGTSSKTRVARPPLPQVTRSTLPPAPEVDIAPVRNAVPAGLRWGESETEKNA
jgi:phenylacetate-CoA ligase